MSAIRYRTIVADPPWPYKTPGAGPLGSAPSHRPQSWTNRDNNSGSEQRYGKMSMADLRALRVPAADSAHLYLWTTNKFMVEAHDLAHAWGFEPKTILTWTKVKADGSVSMKTGYYFRGATEHCIFAVRGSLRLNTVTTGYPTGFLWPRLAHSVKPPAFYDLVEQVSPGPYLEMFARTERLGWDQWGDQSLGTASMEAMTDQPHVLGYECIQPDGTSVIYAPPDVRVVTNRDRRCSVPRSPTHPEEPR